MSLFALIIALLLEKYHPLTDRKRLNKLLFRYIEQLHHYFNTGLPKHGEMAWMLVVIPIVLLTILLYWLLYWIHPSLAWLMNVLVMYVLLSYRPFTQHFESIRQALSQDQLELARQQLSLWRQSEIDSLDRNQLSRLAIEQVILESHHKLFGPVAWFVLFSVIGLGGAAGAVLYRLSYFLYQQWVLRPQDKVFLSDIQANLDNTPLSDSSEQQLQQINQHVFARFTRRAFALLDWLPVRVSALTYAVVGNFENTLYCWRSQASSWSNQEEGVLLASAAGALGIRLGLPIQQQEQLVNRPELGLGDDADADLMPGVIGMIWRAGSFLLILLLLMTLANLLG